MIGRQGEAGERDDLGDGDLDLHARQGHAEAGVEAVSQGEVARLVTGDIQPIRIGVLRRISVAGVEQPEGALTRRDDRRRLEPS